MSPPTEPGVGWTPGAMGLRRRELGLAGAGRQCAAGDELMGLLTKLVLLPLAPVDGVIWIARQLEEQANEQLYGSASIGRQLAELREALDAGDITEQEYLEDEDLLLDRLDEARAMEEASGTW